MSIEAIAPAAASPFAAQADAAAGMLRADTVNTDLVAQVRGNGSADFATMIEQGLGRVDASLRSADAKVRSLAAGEDIPLHEVMISMEQARLDLMLVVEVRNRLVEAYQELTRMQL